MATLTGVSYLDFASRMDPDNKIRTIIELCAQTNPLMEDGVAVEGNLTTGHKSTTRTGLPAVTWRALGYGVPPSKSITSQVVDTCGMLEAYAEVDKALADLNGNTAAWRLSEDRAFLEAMNQEMASTTIYGSQITTPLEFTGFAPRYPTAGGVDPLVSTFNCIHSYAGGANNTSIWLVVWGENTVHYIYPKGSQAGFQMEDKGQVTIDTATPVAGSHYEGYRSHYRWDIGLTVRDWRYVVRCANLEVAAFDAAGTVPILDAMTLAYTRVPNMGMGRPVFYANQTCLAWLWIQATHRANVNLNVTNPEGKPVLNFMGIPVKRCDAILNNEAHI